jgi:outer membrane protein assembly factor BamA
VKLLPKIFLLCLLSVAAFAQNDKMQLQLYVADGDSFSLKKIKFEKQHTDLASVQNELQQILFRLYEQGYLTASFDSMAEQADKVEAWLTAGNRYEWAKLRTGNLEKQLLNEINFKEKIYDGRIFSYTEVSSICNNLLTELENNGYPFAVVRLDSIVIKDNTISASLHAEKNQVFRYDTIFLQGDSRISKHYLYNYLGIRPNNIYDESTIKKIDNRIRQLSFLAADKPVEILFIEDKAQPKLTLSNRKASQFDFLIGFLPNNAETGKLLITGEANINLVSPFGFGENLRLNWRKMQARTQNLDVGFSFPYIISLPFGIDAGLRLYKRDTLFLDVDWDAGLSYLFAGGNYFKAFVNNRFSNVLNIDTNQIISSRQLPEYSDTKKWMYGLEYYYERLDYRFNPREGYVLKLRGAAGTRKIKPNETITKIIDPENPDRTFDYLYDSLKLNTVQYKFDLKFEKYFSIAKRSAVKAAVNGGAIIADQIFVNEMYRLGGTKLLRGFDEESIYSSLFSVLSVEYRFLLAENSYFNIFADGAYTQSKTVQGLTDDFPYGFGAGLAFGTKAGIFNISYALGSQQGAPINFRAAKIHFGYVNLF